MGISQTSRGSEFKLNLCQIHAFHKDVVVWTSDVDAWSDMLDSYEIMLSQMQLDLSGRSQQSDLTSLLKNIRTTKIDLIQGLKNKLYETRQDLRNCLNEGAHNSSIPYGSEHHLIKERIEEAEDKISLIKSDFLDLRSDSQLERQQILTIERLIVATDFSENAERATDYALSILSKTSREIILLHVGKEDYSFPKTSSEDLFDKELKRIASGFPDVLEKIRPVHKLGALSKWLKELTKETESCLVVMGAQGEGDENIPFGKSLRKVLREVSLPVMVVPNQAPLLPPRQVALAADLNPLSSLEGIGILKSLENTYHSKIDLVHVRNTEARKQGTENAYTRKTAKLVGYPNAPIHLVDSKSIIQGLNQFVKQNSIDLLTMISHHDNQIQDIFDTSLSEKMILQSHTPILVIHGKK